MAQAPGGPPPPQDPPQGMPQTGGRIAERASFWQRLVAVVVDSILLGIVGSILAAILGQPGIYERGAAGNGMSFLLGLAYYIYFHGSPSGQTIGKKLMSIRVVGFQHGGPIGFGSAALRYIATILSAIPCGLGYWWMLWDSEKQTWHDKIASTVVVPEAAAPVAKWPG